MSWQFRLAANLAVLTSLASGVACADGVGQDGSVPAAKSVTAIPAGAPLIDQDKLTFIPEDLRVLSGSTVYLKNSESAVHTVTIEGKNVSGVMRENDVLAWVPPRRGTYRITCDYHPKMLAKITAE